MGKGDVNIIKNSLPEDGFLIVKISNLRESCVLSSRRIPVLSDVNIKIERGKLVTIMGPSGSGKNILVNLTDCLDKPTDEQIFIKSCDFNKMSDKELARLKELEIGFLFQTFNLVPRLTAFENVLLPTLANSTINTNPESHARELFEVMRLNNRMHHRPGKLSGGQSQRISIAYSLINNPAILLADEPTENLDSRTEVETLCIFMDVNNEGRTVVIVTHDSEIAKYANRVALGKDGIIQYN